MALIAENHLEQQALDQVIFFQAADGVKRHPLLVLWRHENWPT